MRLFAMAAVSGLVLAANGPATARDHVAGPIEIAQPWARPVLPGASTGAGYMALTNTGKTPDRLIAGTAPDMAKVEIHEMTMDGAVMRMRQLAGGVVLPPGQTVTLKPGGLHVMLIGPKRSFAAGERIPVTLRFEHAGPVKAEFLVMSASPEAR